MDRGRHRCHKLDRPDRGRCYDLKLNIDIFLLLLQKHDNAKYNCGNGKGGKYCHPRP